MMLFRYERLPNHYFRCDRLGHSMCECMDKPITDEKRENNLNSNEWRYYGKGVNVNKVGVGGFEFQSQCGDPSLKDDNVSGPSLISNKPKPKGKGKVTL
ncbi:hypothetical protein QYF36_008207 [Acer negundo]|nr:hypothetical protein QYF36_008207 [Acer negundo]